MVFPSELSTEDSETELADAEAFDGLSFLQFEAEKASATHTYSSWDSAECNK